MKTPGGDGMKLLQSIALALVVLTAPGLATIAAADDPVATAAPPPPSFGVTAASLPVGDWSDFYANGNPGTLHITSIDAHGNLTGSAFGKPMQGFWDGFAGKITFEVGKASADLQVYTGFLHKTANGTTFQLDGSFEAFSGSGGTAQRNVFDWFARYDDVVLASLGTVQSSVTNASLVVPSTWTINVNDFTGKLVIATLDAQGNVSGTLFNSTIQGFWDAHQKKLTFIRFGSFSDATQLQIYSGYFSTAAGSDGVLAGQFEAFAGTGAVAQRSTFGWYATR
jgi:hypothetical protein